jgi:hypothetical protein
MSLAGQLRFEGPVECRCDPAASGLTLSGRSGSGLVHVTLVGTPPPDFPARLESPVLERIADHEYRIASGGDSRTVRARRVFVHCDAREVFCAAVPARPAPLVKRLFWRALLAFAASAPGRRLLGGRTPGA